MAPRCFCGMRSGSKNPWIGFELQGTTSNRDAIGARIIVTSGGRQLVRDYGRVQLPVAHDKRVIVGLGPNSAGKPLVQRSYGPEAGYNDSRFGTWAVSQNHRTGTTLKRVRIGDLMKFFLTVFSQISNKTFNRTATRAPCCVPAASVRC